MSAAPALRRALARHRLRIAARRMLRAGVALTLWGALGFLAALFLTPLASPSWAWPLLGGGLAAGVAAGLFLLRPLWRRMALADAASLAAGDATLKNLLATGADLDAWGEGGAHARGVSPELARAQVEAADRAASGPLPPLPPISLPELPFALLALSALLLTVFAGPDFLRRPFGGVALEAEGELALGNLKVTYHPPAYTGLPPVTEEGTDGEIRAYPGTRVTLEAKVSLPVEGGELSAPGNVAVAATAEGGVVRAEWTVKAEGVYRLTLRRDGKEYAFRPRRVSLVPDNAPTVDLLLPEGDREARASVEIPVRWRARDDFALGRVELVLQGAEEVRIPLTAPRGREGEGETTFLPAAFPKLGDGAYLRVAAFDTDDVNGPKEGSSRTVFLSFLSRSRMEEEIAALEERLMEAMLAHLADHLEEPAPAGAALLRLQDAARALAKLMDNLAERAARGRDEGLLGEAAILNIQAGLTGALQGWLAAPQAGNVLLVAELERDILFLDALSRQMRMEEALSLGEELSALQRDLAQRLQGGEDAQNLTRTVERIEALLRAMTQKLSKQGELPDGFANADAVREPPKDSLGEMLKELREALKKGDREKAAALADKISQALEKWLEDLDKAADAEFSGESDPVAKEMEDIAGEVRKIAAEQERVLGETRRVADAASAKSAEALRGEMRKFIERQQERLEAIQRATGGMEALVPRERLSSQRDDPSKPTPAERLMENRNRVHQAARHVRTSLEQRPGDALAELEKLGDAVAGVEREAKALLDESDAVAELERRAGTARNLAQEIADDLRQLLGRRKEALDPGERRKSRALAAEEESLRDRIGEVGKRLGDLGKESPFVGGGLPELAGKAQGEARKAGGALGGEDPFAAVPSERAVLDNLAELSADMDEAMRQMGGQPNPGGRRPSGSPRGGRGERGREVDRSHVEIPAEAEARQWREFRQEVLKAMQEGKVPETYRREVEKYYEGLIR